MQQLFTTFSVFSCDNLQCHVKQVLVAVADGDADADAGPRLPTPLPTPSQEPKAKEEPADVEMTDEERDEVAKRDAAAVERTKGNEAYKAKRFDEALAHYDAALELYDKDISFITNK